MFSQSENSQKNELNFWNGKVATLRRDLEYQQVFAEKMQEDNRKLQEDVDNLKRVLDNKEKHLQLATKEAGGLKEDNERLNRMYQLMQKEAFNNVERLKKQDEFKRGFQPLRQDKPRSPVAIQQPPAAQKKTQQQNMWQVVDDGFGSSRELSNITYNVLSDQEHHPTMKRDQYA